MQHVSCGWLCHTPESCAVHAATCGSGVRRRPGTRAAPWESGLGLRSVPPAAVALDRCLTARLQQPPVFRGTAQDLPFWAVVWITRQDS